VHGSKRTGLKKYLCPVPAALAAGAASTRCDRVRNSTTIATATIDPDILMHQRQIIVRMRAVAGGAVLLGAALLCPNLAQAQTQDAILRVFAWEGYVSVADLDAVNARLAADHNPVRAKLIAPFAEGPEQMFLVMRQGRADVTFLTLNYLKMQNEKTATLLQTINVDSPRLYNYRQVLPELKAVPMGMRGAAPLYAPFGGGAYGLWVNRAKVAADALPTSLHDLLAPRWKGHISLTRGQAHPNVALALMATGQPPFVLDALIAGNRRAEAKELCKEGGAAHTYLKRLYAQVGAFWDSAPQFAEPLWIVASYGPEIAALNVAGQDWQMLKFKEGDTVWLDTMNITRKVTGRKLEAAEIFINYFLGKEVQNRVVRQLGMVAVTQEVRNPLIKDNPDFFSRERLWPPYNALADNLMRRMSEAAMPAAPNMPTTHNMPEPSPSILPVTSAKPGGAPSAH
jgi:spermidine/putrescine-binding protein